MTNVKDIFHPVGTNDGNNYHHIHPIAIQADGTIFSNTQSGKCGWNFSNGSGASNLGHNTTDQLSGDDGAWGFIIPTGSNTGYVDGNSPGETWFSTASGNQVLVSETMIVVIVILTLIGMELIPLVLVMSDSYSVEMLKSYLLVI